MKCPWCHESIEKDSVFCENCGKRIPRCPTCGKVVEAGTRFCDEDGAKIPEEILALFTAEATVRVRPAPQPVEKTPVYTKPQPAEPQPAEPQPALEQTVYVPPVVPVPQPAFEQTAYVPPVVPAYENQPQPQKKSGKGLTIFVVLLLAALVLVGGYFVWTEYFGEDEEEASEGSSASGKKDDGEESEDGENGEKDGTGGSAAAPDATKPADGTIPTTPATPEPEITYEYRYEIIQSDMSWSDADAVCRSKGGYLATIDSPEEYAVICALAEETNSKLADGDQLVYLWLGSYLPPDSTEWKWSTGETIPLNNFYWYKNEPSYEDNGVRENCLCLWDLSYNGYDWTLNDQRNDLIKDFPSLSGKLGYVCEYKIEVRK